MRAERRQELRTNQLSQSLEDVRQYLKENAVWFTVLVLAAVIGGGGYFGYTNWQENRREEAWNKLDNPDSTADAGMIIDNSLGVAQQQIDASITVAALLKVGSTALKEIVLSTGSTNGPGPTTQPAPRDWAQVARDAYGQLLQQYSNDTLAVGQAMVGLGLVEESQGSIEKAREWYKKVADDPRFAATALPKQASYRLAGLDRWSKPIVFPPPAMTVPIPEEAPAAGSTPKPPTITPAAPGGTAGGPMGPSAPLPLQPVPPPTGSVPAPVVPAASDRPVGAPPTATTQPAGGAG